MGDEQKPDAVTERPFLEPQPLQEREAEEREISRAQRRRAARKFGYVVAIVVNLILIYVFNNLLRWNWRGFWGPRGVLVWPIVTPRWADVLWALNLSISVSIVSYILLLLYDPLWLRQLAEIIRNLFGILVLYMFYAVFPFDFGYEMIDKIVRWALLLAILGTVLGTTIQFFKMITGKEE